jgi:CubicO group peptidase (beta-lactamase class C family)
MSQQKKKNSMRAFGMLFFLVCIVSLLNWNCGAKAQKFETGLEYVEPEDVGWSSEKLEEAKTFAEKINSAAVMVLYDGKVFISWGDVDKNYSCHSIRKPFLSALYGIYRERGKIDLDVTLEELNIDDIPPLLTQEEKKATVRDLLKSRSGVYHEAAAEAQVMMDTRPARGSHPPDTFYYYNNWDFNALGTIFEQETEAKIFEAFKKEIADPIGMEDFSIENCEYFYQKDKSQHPSYSFRMSARDMARFGLLYLRKGNWNGRQIIPQDWIEESTQAYSTVSEEMGVGYGYMWNVVRPKGPFAQIFGGQEAFYHTGIGIHTLAVIPGLKLVYIYRYDTDGSFQDPGEATLQLVSMIMNARISKE